MNCVYGQHVVFYIYYEIMQLLKSIWQLLFLCQKQEVDSYGSDERKCEK